MSSLYDSILKNKKSKQVAIYFQNKKISYEDFFLNVDKMISYLSKFNLKRGDVVTVSLPNIPSNIYLFYALNHLGVIQNIIHPLMPLNVVFDSIKETDSKAVFLMATQNVKKNYSYFQNKEIKIFFTNPIFDNNIFFKYGFYLRYPQLKRQTNIFSLDKFSKVEVDYFLLNSLLNYDISTNNETSILLHSGGTSGKEKIIELSNDSLDNLAMKVPYIVKTDVAGRGMLAALPTFHGFGLGMGIHSPLFHNASICLMMKFSPKLCVKWINENKLNMMIGVPQLYNKLMNTPSFHNAELKNLDYSFVGGDQLSINLLNKFNALMKSKGSQNRLYQGYGLTEVVSVCTVNSIHNSKIGSVGLPLFDNIIIICDDELNVLDSEEVGEILVKTDTMMNAYFKDNAQTKNTIIRIGRDKYIRTGDLGYLDKEGFLFYKGRKKNLIKIWGVNVFPLEVIELVKKITYVKECAYVFYEENKPHTKLFLSVDKNLVMLNDEQIKSNVFSFLENNLIKYALPKEIIILDDLPKTKVLKIDENKLKEMYP